MDAELTLNEFMLSFDIDVLDVSKVKDMFIVLIAFCSIVCYTLTLLTSGAIQPAQKQSQAISAVVTLPQQS